MVLIHEEKQQGNNNDDRNNNDSNHRDPQKHPATTNEDRSSTTTTANNDINKDADDGFETASDGDITDSDKDNDHDDVSLTKQQEQQPQLSQEQVSDDAPENNKEDKHDDNVVSQTQDDQNDEESKQRALAEANDFKLQGNSFYGSGQYEEALKQYELALQTAPDNPSSTELRSICHANRAMCFLKLAKYEDTVKECTKALQLNPTYLKALIRRGEANEKLEHYEEAVADLKKILELDPSNDQARRAIRRLEPLAAEQREKMKEEMIGKLKEMGNSILGRFGMSTDNFKAVKDPNTGSYSIQFQR